MNWEERASIAIEQLLMYAERKNLIESVDVPYCRNLLLDVMGMELPCEVQTEDTMNETATLLVGALCDLAQEKGLIGEMSYERELFSARVMGCVTPSPAMVRRSFSDAVAAGDARKATDDFYNMCRDSDYIKVDAIAQNVRFFEQTKAGELEITINLSKPEKDPKEIAKLKNAPSIGYPKCMLCVENPGYAGRSNFPARQNHRIVPIKLDGADWFIQYSPYAYYSEHCIVFNSKHVPMKIDRGTFCRLFDFVGQFPHYMLGSNADLPIVGGSILSHDHFQGGNYSFPMDKAPVKFEMTSPVAGVKASVLDWPMSCLVLEGKEPEKIIDLAETVLKAWQGYSDPACDVYAETEGNPHNTITPIARKQGDTYRLALVLRNNRTSEEHPLGIFHPHAPLHHIKKENIGLIEVMGLFILPGRLKTEIELLCDYMTGEKPMVRPDAADPCEKHFDWLEDVVARNGIHADREESRAILRKEIADVCAQVLADAGVFKQDGNGIAGMKRFLTSVGFAE
ncbi:MAG: UDP-glucose--hexose-1-phosphate uridylyltransferase [Clostridia bacterium]|nr:UDP-glucose--hexose-1-phosphate uridylyltransferase [Clostridia bacterium]